jgi:uncharacterized protein YbjQ (UPF0145 family)
MPNCRSCGQRLMMMDDELGRCLDCANANKPVSNANTVTEAGNRQRQAEASLERFQARRSSEKQRTAAINAILLTTETAPNLNITKRIEIVTAECAFGMNIFKDLFAGVRNIVGGRSEAVQKTMRDSRRTTLYELKKEAYEVGANAVVGVDLDYVELAGTGSSMVVLVASGTAVVIEGENG